MYLRRFIFLLFFLGLLNGFFNNAVCQDQLTPQNHAPNENQPFSQENLPREESEDSWWQKIWGKKARDALLLGMWTLHLDGTGEYFGDGRNNDQAHLIGAQYYGLTAGTFINSHNDRAWFFGPAREIYSRNYSEDTRLDIGYRFGLLYGYGDELFNVGGMSVFAAATIGITWKRLGFDLGIIPVGVLTASFRIDIDNLFKGGKQKRAPSR